MVGLWDGIEPASLRLLILNYHREHDQLLDYLKHHRNKGKHSFIPMMLQIVLNLMHFFIPTTLQIVLNLMHSFIPMMLGQKESVPLFL